MSDSFFSNPSDYEGQIIKENKQFRSLIKELLIFINRNGLDFDNETEIQELLIKTEIQSRYDH